MGTISTWVLSVAGISVLSVLVDLILPLGQTKKYIKGVFALIVVVVVITPIFDLFKSNFKATDIFEENAVVIQEDFVYQINQDRLNKIEDMIISSLKEEGVADVNLILNANIFAEDLVVGAVFVDLQNACISENLQHKDIKEIIIKNVQKYLDINRQDIIFN